MSEETLVKMPNTPQEFGVTLAPAELRRLDFSALDFSTLSRASVEYIRSYHSDSFNDFFASNGVMMLVELLSYIGGNLSQRSDILIDEAFLPTAQTKEAVIQHLALINQSIQRATPATVEVEISLSAPTLSEIKIPAATSFTLNGPDNVPLYYEIFRAPGDFTSPISIPPGKRGVIAYGIEGNTNTPLVRVSNGNPNQFIDLESAEILDEPITVEVSSGDVSSFWTRVPIIEKAGANDEVFEVRHLEDSTRIWFGDNVAGKAPLSGQDITVRYRTGGGIRGRIGAGSINETRSVIPEPPYTAAVEALFRNPTPSSGGTDEENIAQAKKRAPRNFATHDSAITGEDYGLLAQEYSHPVFGSVSKAIGVLRTGVDQDFDSIASRVRSASSDEEAAEILMSEYVNRNIVELYVLAEGPDGVPIKPNSGLKRGLVSYFDQINVLTDEVRVFDGAIKTVDVEAIVVVSRSADPGTVKVAVQEALTNFFDLRNFDMGVGLFLSHLYNIIQDVPGVKFVDIFKPQDDVIQTFKIADSSAVGVGFNEVITLGQVDLRYYFEPGNFRVPQPGR